MRGQWLVHRAGNGIRLQLFRGFSFVGPSVLYNSGEPGCQQLTVLQAGNSHSAGLNALIAVLQAISGNQLQARAWPAPRCAVSPAAPRPWLVLLANGLPPTGGRGNRNHVGGSGCAVVLERWFSAKGIGVLPFPAEARANHRLGRNPAFRSDERETGPTPGGGARARRGDGGFGGERGC